MKTSLSPRRASSSSPAATSSSSMPSVLSNMNSEHGQNNNDGVTEITCTNENDIHRTMTSSTSRDRPMSPVANALEHDDKRPHAPVSKQLLHENERKHRQKPFETDDDDSNIMIPPPQSPNRGTRHHHSMPSPPTIISSPNLTSPHIPAAPPTTPYSPFAAANNKQRIFPAPAVVPTFAEAQALSPPNLNNVGGHESPPLSTASSSNGTNTNSNNNTIINTLLSPPNNPFHNDTHTTNLLRQTLLQTQSDESSRITQLTSHETTNYTTISEYRHALARERRHSLSLALQLAHYKFLSKYTSCSLHSKLEISEEGRMNKVLKSIDCKLKDMKEDKIRCVMELEREEEGLVNGLMGRLEGVRREKRMLEERVYGGSGGSVGGGFGSSSGGGGGEFERMVQLLEEQKRREQQQQQQQQGQQEQRGGSSLVEPFGRMDVDAQDTGPNNFASSCTEPTPPTPSAIDVFPCLKEDEEEEEEEEEDFNDDILGGRHHDADMEEELEKMLKMKESKKSESG